MEEKKSKYSSIHYNSYLQLDKILNAQDLRSTEVGEPPAHDEMLFIIVHQVYELWFKQINYELRAITKKFHKREIQEKDVAESTAKLDRVIEIMKLLVQQIGILETMTPLDFLEFRNYLFPASGFQSFQFREIEVMLGLKEDARHTYQGKSYTCVFDEHKRDKLEELEHSASLLQLIERWLERTPFLEWGDFSFLESYQEAVAKMLKSESELIRQTDILSAEFKEMRLKMLGDTHTYFAGIFDEERHNELIREGRLKLSYRATIAALFIHLYRDEPILRMPYLLLSKLVEMDDHLTTWRYRHAQMVMKMLGKKVGTGGSSGHEYLATTAAKHHIFSDLHNVSTLLIPRSELPELPTDLIREMGFFFSTKA
jgi:tryptophan 2,3-dioxygenase